MLEQKLIEDYWKSIAEELKATEDRIRNLIDGFHWLTDGRFKEHLIRNIIQRHLPEQYKLCTGFIRTGDKLSTEIDILIIDRSSFTLFKEDDFVIVTPSAVKAIIEVKTRLSNSSMNDVLEKLAKNAKMVDTHAVWSGLFVYQPHSEIIHEDNGHQNLLQAVNTAYKKSGSCVNCIAYGSDSFVRYWSKYEGKKGKSGWTSYYLQDLSAAYFIGNLITHLASDMTYEDSKVLFPIKGTKEKHRRYFIAQGGKKVKKLKRW